MRRSYLLVLLCLSFLLSGPIGCTKAPDFWEEAKPGQKRILVSFPPLYCLTHAIAGDDAYVLCMLTGHGPHDYDGSATDLLKVRKANLFIYNGLTLDELFVEKMLRNHQNESLVTLSVGDVLEKKHHDLMLHMAHHHDDKEKGKKDPNRKDPHAGHKHGDHDPHIWLGPKQAIAMTRIIADKLAKIDSAHGFNYIKRADALVAELEKLEQYGKEKFKDKKNKKIITMHEAFGYFADAFDIDIKASIQQNPGMDPDAATMARLVKLCRDEKIGVIAVEQQYSKAPAEALKGSLQGKVDVTVIELDPLETAKVSEKSKHNPDPGYYLKKMRENIDTLAKALK